MPEHDWIPAASNFVSSFVKSLHILCNSQVKFTESIELVGHINVRVDHKYKFDYVVDEQVSKESEDSATTFLSNSYQACPPSRKAGGRSFELGQDVTVLEFHQNIHERSRQSEMDQGSFTQSHGYHAEDILMSKEKTNVNYSVKVGSSNKQGSQANQMVVKLEEDSYSSDCMLLPATLSNYEPVFGVNGDSFQTAGQSALIEDGQSSQAGHVSKCQQGPPAEEFSNVRSSEKGMKLRSSTAKLKLASKISKDQETNKNSNIELKSSEPADPVSDIKQLISKLAAFCDMTVVQDDMLTASKNVLVPSEEDTKSAKKLFLHSFDKEQLKKIKEVLKMKKGRQKKQQLHSLLAESGLSNEQLLLLAQDTNARRNRISWRSIPEGPRREAMLKEHRKALRLKTQEHHQRLLGMAEMLKRNQMNDPGITIVSKSGEKKCILQKSSVSVVSHNTQQLSLDNIDELSEALSGKTKKAFVQSDCQGKSKDQLKLEYSRKTCVKKKMKQIVGKILDEVGDAGYRVIVTSTIGTEAGLHSAELSVVPIKADNFVPESNENDVQPELSEENYATQQNMGQIVEKQQASQEKRKEIERKLLRILTGAEEIFIPMRRRYRKGEPRPSDAERMKEYRKKLKQDPEKYQLYKQKRAMNKKKRRLGELAAKVKVGGSGSAVTVIPAASADEEPHGSQSMGTLVSMTQSVSGVTIHCPEVYEHPSSHQPTVSVVGVHHTTQYVGQMSGIHHQHHQPAAFGNEMDIVELIAAHNVQNQHFG